MSNDTSLKPNDRDIARFWTKVDRRHDDECWMWTGYLDHLGYSRFWIGNRRATYHSMRGHRVAYELLVGRIPDGLTLDHLCLNKGCVNPAHLEVTTRSENSRRSWLTIDRSFAPSKPIPHGTRSGYALHRYRHQIACDDCRRANATYERERKARVA